MALENYSRPKPNAAFAAAAAQRLAEKYDSALRRYVVDGTIEVAVMKSGRLDRHLVYTDGTTRLLQSLPPTARYVRGRRMLLGGFALCFATLIGLGIFFPNGEGGAARFIPLFLVGMALAARGGILRERDDIQTRLRQLDGAGEAWHTIPKLDGWAPRTSEQLAAVEALADEREGLALVRDLGDGTTEVVTARSGRLFRHLVDESGTTLLLESAPRSLRFLCGVSMAIFGWAACLVIFFTPFFARWAWGFFIAFGLSILGALLGNDFRSRARKGRGNKKEWFEFRTREDDDGG